MPKKKPLTKLEKIDALYTTIKQFTSMSNYSNGVIIGIDPGRVSPGLCIINAVGEDEIEIRGLKTTGSGFSKVMQVEEWLLKHLIVKPIELAVMEDYAFESKWGRELAGEMHGVIMRYLWNRRIPLIKVAPIQLKNFVGSKAKEHIMKDVFRKWGYDTNNSDEADAIVLAKLGKALYNITKWACRAEYDRKEFETNPHKFIDYNQKEARTLINILETRGSEAHAFAGKEASKKSTKKSTKSRTKTRIAIKKDT